MSPMITDIENEGVRLETEDPLVTDLFNKLGELREKGPKGAINAPIELLDSRQISSVSSFPSSTPDSGDSRANERL